MKYSIGYQPADEFDSTYSLCADYREHIGSVYFSWANEKSGRMPLCADDNISIEEISSVQLQELKKIKKLGIPLVLLFNANCYGDEESSIAFADKILKLCHYLKSEIDISSVTTTSPFVAKTIKKEFSDNLKVTASVNMRIDNILTMQQLDAYFDGFYLRKELNRNIEKIKELKKWCDDNNKTLSILANSGCISYCGFQTFHDNLVAHRKYMQKSDAEGRFASFCREYLFGLSQDEALAKILAANFIRPEDTHFYEPYFSEMKLATRMHSSPRRVIHAYAKGRFSGNLLDLTEPSYSSLFKGCILDNRCVPEDWFEITGNCDKNCAVCRYCLETAEKIKRFFEY